MTLHFQIITPEKIVLQDDVDEIIAPTTNGQVSILPNHITLLTRVTGGELITKKAGKENVLAVTGGFLEVGHNTVTLLADYAVHSADINVAKAEEAKKRAEKLLEEKTSEQDFVMANSELQKALLELKVATKRKQRPTPPGQS